MDVIERKFASSQSLDLPFGDGISNPDRLEWLGTWTRDDYMVETWDTQTTDGRGWPVLAFRFCILDRERVLELTRANGAPDTMQDQMGDAFGQELAMLPVWEIVFTGEEFSPGAAAGDDELTLANLLGFLSCKPGDTDAEFFKDYTPRQLEFATEHGEELAIWSADLEGELD